MTRSAAALLAGLVLVAAGSPARARDRLAPALRALPAEIDAAFRAGRFPAMSVGVVRGDRLIFKRHLGAVRHGGGPPTDDALWRIASVTKTFTTTLLALERDAGRLRLDDPVQPHLPRGTRLPTDPRGAPAITFRHLATHTSGLPIAPANFGLRHLSGAATFTEADLLRGLGFTRLEHPPGTAYAYSNLGVGLLGWVLGHRAGRGWEALVKERLLDPLRMADTAVRLDPARERRLATGHYEGRCTTAADPYRYGSLHAAGGLASSLADLARWVALQLRAGQPGVQPVPGSTLAELHRPQRLLPQTTPGRFADAIGLGWHVRPLGRVLGEVVYHGGHTAGFRTFVGFVTARQLGVIVLASCGNEVDPLGFAILDRLVEAAAGRPRP